jgi:hypothetical protein
MTYDDVREIALELRGVEESTSYGTAALKVRGKLFVRLKEDGETIVLRTDPFERDHLMRTHPKIFYITDHYRDYPWVLVRLRAVRKRMLAALIESAWQHAAPKSVTARKGVAAIPLETVKTSRAPNTKRARD